MNMKGLEYYLTLRNFVAFILILFCIQYIPIESRAGVSYIKLFVSLICPLILFVKSFKCSKAMILLMLYYLLVLAAAILHPDTLRWSTLLFLGTFLCTYITYYNLVLAEEVFTECFFIQLVKKLILAFAITLIIQQFFILIGFRVFPLINLTQNLNRGIGANSLSYEPSSAARIMCVAYLALIRMIEIKKGSKVTIVEMFKETKWVTLLFLWSILTMGSGTAFIALGLLSVYFFHRNASIIILLLLGSCYCIIPYIDYWPLQRAYNVFNAVLTGAQDNVISTDVSAATRITPLMNVFTKLDWTDLDSWFGHGVDYTENLGDYKAYMKDGMIGGVQNYGLLSFFIMQVIIYTCVIRSFFSVESLFWILIFSMSFANVPYTWGAMMIFTATRYFQLKNAKQ